MIFEYDQRRETCEVPRVVKEWKDVNTGNAHNAGGGFDGDERGIDRTALQRRKLVGYVRRQGRITERGETERDRVAVPRFRASDCNRHGCVLDLDRAV
jgi:hypothetical protein